MSKFIKKRLKLISKIRLFLNGVFVQAPEDRKNKSNCESFDGQHW
ncbi:hypothetical protein [[Clostridium] fimetarium]|uniref:Uncharacterized protein n=1 Tax=[Clostridium] fimetarium TaxID=99656 RepID=A0A1I0RDQ3_9FIRM|nr:hypothetical protein [[Clostridium] fimetarium]SEW38981.1 hypothetical protein SAMN05421659_11474 [[Clostridium] fimetarium]